MGSFISELGNLLTYYNIVFLLQGAVTTIALSAFGCILGGLFGTALAVARLTTTRLTWPLRALALIFTEFFRRVPFLVTLMLCFFVFQFSGLDVSTLTVGCVTVVLIGTAFLAEIVRAGLQSVHPNQWHAAEAMNFSLLQTIRYVVLPQAWTVILPPAFGFFILFIKDSALASQIGVVELTYVGKVFNNRGFSAGLSFGVILIAYFMLSYPLSRLGAKLEKKLGTSRTR
jgi:polar amino acid transport system permease protein